MATKTATALRLHRPGEGALVDVVRTSGAANHVIQFSADLSMAPVPDKRYVADIVNVVQSEAARSVRVLFGQRKIVGKGLRSLLVIHMTFESVWQFLGSLDNFNGETKKAFKDIERGTLYQIEEEPEQTVALSSSIIVAGITGAEACLDMYYVSPFSIQKIQVGGKMAVDPVVRITVPTSMFLSMCEKLQDLAPAMPSDEGKEIQS